MSRNSYLQKLREDNNGYNPENIEGHPHLKVVEDRRGFVVIENTESGDDEIWTRSEASSEAEFIEKWPRVFALVIQDSFYYKAS